MNKYVAVAAITVICLFVVPVVSVVILKFFDLVVQPYWKWIASF